MKSLCIYHSSDMDGQCSAAIVKHFVHDCAMHGANYGDAFPWSTIEQYDKIYIVDFSYPIEDMQKIFWDAGKELIYIDHHITAIEAMDDLVDHLYKMNASSDDQKFITVTRYTDSKRAACDLTWEFFSEGDWTPLPIAVRYAANYDIWDHDDMNTLYFQYGMREHGYGWGNHIWEDLLSNASRSVSILDQIVHTGKIVYEFEQSQNARYARTACFDMEWLGLKLCACNRVGGGSMIVDAVFDKEKHDAVLIFGWMKDHWKVSLYAHGSKNVDMHLGELCKKYGGGGHKNAAGFECASLPFELA